MCSRDVCHNVQCLHFLNKNKIKMSECEIVNVRMCQNVNVSECEWQIECRCQNVMIIRNNVQCLHCTSCNDVANIFSRARYCTVGFAQHPYFVLCSYGTRTVLEPGLYRTVRAISGRGRQAGGATDLLYASTVP